jgi:uncharacterized protein
VEGDIVALYAISDLHLDFIGDKPMDIFGEKWSGHSIKIKENWDKKIRENDTVLIAGDISWSMKMEDGIKDLEWIHNLAGRKIFVKGNHDYWWGSISKLNQLFEGMDFIQNNFFAYEDYAICGTRGWTYPGGEAFTAKDEKIYERELLRLRLSIDSARKAGYSKFIIMLHYPPVGDQDGTTGFTEIIDEAGAEMVIYGHLHGPSVMNAFEGYRNGVKYIFTSSDFINFNPVKIL